jgi:hypothetical protein
MSLVLRWLASHLTTPGTPAGNNWEPAGNGWDLGNGQATPDHQDGPPTQALPGQYTYVARSRTAGSRDHRFR